MTRVVSLVLGEVRVGSAGSHRREPPCVGRLAAQAPGDQTTPVEPSARGMPSSPTGKLTGKALDTVEASGRPGRFNLVDLAVAPSLENPVRAQTPTRRVTPAAHPCVATSDPARGGSSLPPPTSVMMYPDAPSSTHRSRGSPRSSQRQCGQRQDADDGLCRAPRE